MWLLGKGGILVPQVGRQVPMTLRVLARRDSKGRPYQVWDRTFHFPRRKLRFKTTLVYDPTIDRVGDVLGPANRIFIIWRATFRPPTAFTLDTERVALRIGRKRVRLPRLIWHWLFGRVHHSQWTDPAQEDVMHVELMLWQPLVGYFFGYEGVFRLTREEKDNPAAYAQDPIDTFPDRLCHSI
jgi:hypothetical protein